MFGGILIFWRLESNIAFWRILYGTPCIKHYACGGSTCFQQVFVISVFLAT